MILWNSDDETVGTKTTGDDGNVTWTGLPADTYTYGVHSRLDEHLGGGSVTLDTGEHAVVQFEPTAPYVDNDRFLEPADEDFTHAPLDAAGGPRFHYHPGETVTLRAAVRNNETTGSLFGGLLGSETWPINVTFEILISDRDGGIVRVDSVSTETTIGSQTTTVVTAEYTIPRAADYTVRTEVRTNYTKGYVLTDVSGSRRNEFSAWDSFENLRDANWAYNGSSSRASLSGNVLGAKGLDGTNTTIAVLNYGVDTSNPLVNRVDQGEAWQDGRLNVVDAYNPDSSGIEADPGGGYHGMEVASTVWQFAPNASYVIANVRDTDLIDFEDDIEKSFTHVVDEHDPDVVVMSIGRWGWGSEALADTFSSGVDRNTTVIVSAGNLHDEHPAHYPTAPATGEDVWAISSTNRDREICEGASPGNSTRNPDKPDFAAPGCQIRTFGTPLSDGISGSSFAAPATAGSYAQVLQFAHRHDMTGRDVRETFQDVAINTTTWNGSVDADRNGSTFDDDLDGKGRVMPVGAYYELLADDAVPAVDVTVETVHASNETATLRVTLNNTGAGTARNGGVHLQSRSGASFESVETGRFERVQSNTTDGVEWLELYTGSSDVTSGNITLSLGGNTTAPAVRVRGWLVDEHDAVYNPQLGRYERYVARYPRENHSTDGNPYVEGEIPDRSDSNPPFNNHLENDSFSILAYPTTTSFSTGETFLVDGETDGDAAYATIQGAVDDASDGDRVKLRPNTYREEVTVDKSITLIAPDGATLDGSSLSGNPVGIRIPEESSAAPVIEGIRISGYWIGLSADGSLGNWTIRDVVITNSSGDGVDASRSWRAWTIRDALITNSSGDGVDANRTSGNWTIRDTTITNSSEDGVNAAYSFSSGAWTIRNTTVTNSSDEGVDALWSSGAWTIRNTTITTSSEDGVFAYNSRGAWTIHTSTIGESTGTGLNATGADPAGNASYNYWGAPDGPGGDFNGSGAAVVGNVTIRSFYTDAELTTLSNVSIPCVAGAVAGSDDTVSLTEIQTAINWWAEEVEVPDTGGETISLSKIQTLINAWAEGRSVTCG